MIYPSSVVPKVSTDVPEALRLDYIEAHQVWPISAKGSAAMSRRILQSILREQGYNDKNLHDQIQKILAEMDPDKILPSGLHSLIKAVHKFGNFSAHPITDTTTLQIINVDPAEAEWCIDIIGDLFDPFLCQARNGCQEAVRPRPETAASWHSPYWPMNRQFRVFPY